MKCTGLEGLRTLALVTPYMSVEKRELIMYYFLALNLINALYYGGYIVVLITAKSSIYTKDVFV